MVSECECDKFRALCICGTRLTSARRLSRLEIGFWGVTVTETLETNPYEVHDKQQVMDVEILDNQLEDKTRAAPVKDVKEVQIDDRDPNKKTQIGTHLKQEDKAKLIAFLRANKDVFA
ncbi:hypothetical protein SLEP1_g22322 [Rubroshorea leprosula]|uniref:Uncharacterized protein n=1 Tax=Rubroshorea leprosula TaxID=152421 RepID=A0AAV5J8U4_9ROSI|nr:hypothetical protein SLEP1_g22322 [Rubroshorea leprosula]